MRTKEKIVIIGSSGNAEVIIDIIEQEGKFKIIGLIDPYKGNGESVLGYKIIGEEKDLPQLIIIDGGKGQLNSAVKSLEKLNLRGKISIIGIAKRLEEIYFPGDSVPLYLDKRSESLRLVQQLRDEAHRFGITHHRKQRDKDSLGTSLDIIEGIGPKTVQLLLSHFGSVKQVLEAKKEELVSLIGKNKAEKILKN